MPYVEKVTKAGKTIEIEKFYTARYNKKGAKRSKNKELTPDKQKKVNSRKAEQKLRLLINENFKENDYHINCGYKRSKGDPYRTKEEMQIDSAKFLRKLRTEYKKLGLELKYIHVMEIGERGARHHHFVIQNIDIKILTKCWQHGRIHVNPLDKSGRYRRLASYLIKFSDKVLNTKDELQGKRWSASRNLKHPEPVYKIISNRAYFRAEAKAPKNYYVDRETVSGGITDDEYFGYGYFRYTIVKNE